MRKLFILCAFLLQLLSPVYPQQATTATIEPNLKYGKPSKEELSLTSYAPDTTATAIYLFHQGQSDFIYHDGFQLTTEHWVRIKILKPQGVSYADVSVPYYSPTDKDEGQERASEIEGCSYNMENGKCIKTPMKRESISFERFNNLYKILKPNYIHKCTKLKICKIQYFIATLHKNSIYATRRFKHLHLEIERIT